MPDSIKRDISHIGLIDKALVDIKQGTFEYPEKKLFDDRYKTIDYLFGQLLDFDSEPHGHPEFADYMEYLETPGWTPYRRPKRKRNKK